MPESGKLAVAAVVCAAPAMVSDEVMPVVPVDDSGASSDEAVRLASGRAVCDADAAPLLLANPPCRLEADADDAWCMEAIDDEAESAPPDAG